MVTVYINLLIALLQTGDLAELDWLIGTWQIGSEQVFEKWEKVSATEYSGVNFKVSGSDTTVLEYIQLIETEGTVFYIPSVADQNQGKPIPFKLVSSDSNKVVFQNKAHDFPQLIVYHKISNTSIDAWIEGGKNGNFRKASFKMSKLQ